VRELALRALDIAGAGLGRRARLDSTGQDESSYLNPLRQIAESGITPAEELLTQFEGPWKGSVDPAFREHAY
jgi:glutamate--cysteine ligase